MKKVCFIIIYSILTMNCITLYWGEATQDYYFVNEFNHEINIKYVDVDGRDVIINLKENEIEDLITYPWILVSGGEMTLNDLFWFFKEFYIYDKDMNLLRENIFHEDELSLVQKSLSDYYYIYLGRHKDL